MSFQASAEQVRWHRLRLSGLAERRFGSSAAVAHALFGVQAQINSAARLALWHRLEGSGESRRSEIEAAVETERSLVRLWGQRGTLHLYSVGDWALLCAATSARQIAHVEKRVSQRGEGALEHHERARRLTVEILGSSPQALVSKAGMAEVGGDREVEALYGALLSLSMEGVGCRVESGDNASPEFASRASRFPEVTWEPPPFEEAMMRVARRFFGTYAPAAETDFRYWLGAKAGESKAAVRALLDRGELTEGYIDSPDRSPVLLPSDHLDDLLSEPPPPSRWPVCLLGRFDPLLLAHADKRCWVDEQHYKRIWHHTHVEAVVLVRGRIRGFWRSKRGAKGMRLDVQLFDEGRLAHRPEGAISRQADAIAALAGLPLHQLAIRTSA